MALSSTIAFIMLCCGTSSSLVTSLQMVTPLPMLRQHHTTRHWPHRPSSSSSSSSSSFNKATASSLDFALFSTPSNSIDAEIINYKRTLLFPSTSSTTTKHRYRNSHRRRNSGSPLRSSTSSNNNNGNGSSSSADTTAATSTSSSSEEGGGTAAVSFLQAIDKFGMNLKPLAIAAYEQSTQTSSSVNGSSSTTTTSNNNNNTNSNTSIKTIILRLKSNILWTLYILYRGYRGFFVILPAVFREVYRQLESSDLVIDAYNDDDDDDVSNSGVVGGVGGSNEVVEENKPLRWRTRITISILSSILTLSYVVSGALRVLGKFIKTFTNTTSFESSLEAAADEMVKNEDTLKKSTMK